MPAVLSSLQISSGNTAGATSDITSGGFTLVGGNAITLSQSAQVVTINAGAIPKVSWQPVYAMKEIDGQILSKSAAATGALGFGSSLFLERTTVGAMTLTKVDLAMGISFSATNSGQGTMNQSFIIYSFGNSTSLASVASISGTSSWASGTAAAGAPWTSIQGGWSGNLIHPLTFASIAVSQGEYIFGNLFELSMANSGHSAAIYGKVGLLSSSATVFTVAPTVASALSSGGLSAGSVHASTTSTAATIFTATPTAINVLSSSALASFPSGIHFASLTFTNTANIIASATGGTLIGLGSQSAALTMSFASLAGSYHSASVSGAALSNAGTLAWPLLSTGGLVAGSFLTASTAVAAISNTGTGSVALVNGGILSFGFVGTASASTNMNLFVNGILSTGAAPASIALSNAALSYGGNAAWLQPWFGLCGS
jgi:hypothetical protein